MSQNHRISPLEGTTAAQVVQPFCSSRVFLDHMALYPDSSRISQMKEIPQPLSVKLKELIPQNLCKNVDFHSLFLCTVLLSERQTGQGLCNLSVRVDLKSSIDITLNEPD